MERTTDRPIIESILDLDFYKLPMGQMIFHKHPKVPVEFSFLNRSRSVQLGNILDLGELREQLEHCKTLKPTPQELHFVMGTYEYEQPMFSLDYINFFRHIQLPDFHLESRDGQLDLRFFGEWSANTYWETFSMSIINELYFRKLMRDRSRFERDRVEAEGRIRLARKIEVLKSNPNITFSDFGTRRRFSRSWQDYVVGVLVEEFPLQNGQAGQFRGTSNVFSAMKYGVMPTGTNAHELPMAYSGIYHDQDETNPAFSSRMVLQDWESEYKKGLLLFLPDTFGSDWFFKNVVTPEQLRDWAGSRQDSGDPLLYATRRIREYKEAGIDPKQKLIVFADGLTVEKMKWFASSINGQIRTTFGIGTDLTNDVGFIPISIVTKVTKSNGHKVAKLSDNIEKATGSREAVERMKRMVGYTNTFAEACKV